MLIFPRQQGSSRLLSAGGGGVVSSLSGCWIVSGDELLYKSTQEQLLSGPRTAALIQQLQAGDARQINQLEETPEICSGQEQRGSFSYTDPELTIVPIRTGHWADYSGSAQRLQLVLDTGRLSSGWKYHCCCLGGADHDLHSSYMISDDHFVLKTEASLQFQSAANCGAGPEPTSSLKPVPFVRWCEEPGPGQQRNIIACCHEKRMGVRLKGEGQRLDLIMGLRYIYHPNWSNKWMLYGATCRLLPDPLHKQISYTGSIYRSRQALLNQEPLK